MRTAEGPAGATGRLARSGKPLTCGLSEPPVGIEPTTYALRGPRTPALPSLPAALLQLRCQDGAIIALWDASSRHISGHDSASDKGALDLLAFPSGRQPGQRALSASVGFSVLWPRGRGSHPAQRSDAGTDHRAGRPADAGRAVAGRERTVAATAEAVTAGGGGPGGRSGGVVRVGPRTGARKIASGREGGVLRGIVRSSDRRVRDSLGELQNWQSRLAASSPRWLATRCPARGTGVPSAHRGGHHGTPFRGGPPGPVPAAGRGSLLVAGRGLRRCCSDAGRAGLPEGGPCRWRAGRIGGVAVRRRRPRVGILRLAGPGGSGAPSGYRPATGGYGTARPDGSGLLRPIVPLTGCAAGRGSGEPDRRAAARAIP